MKRHPFCSKKIDHPGDLQSISSGENRGGFKGDFSLSFLSIMVGALRKNDESNIQKVAQQFYPTQFFEGSVKYTLIYHRSFTENLSLNWFRLSL